MVGFLLGFMMGFVAAIGLFGFLGYWLCSRPNTIAVAKFINGIAQALAHKPKSSQPLAPGKNGQATDAAMGTSNEKARDR
jgi:hypothetical protein